MKYSFSPKKLNNLKGHISERLIQDYINKNIIPKLKKDGWDIIIYTTNTWFSVPESENFNPSFINERMFFISNRLFPTKKFLNKFKKLTRLLENIPDGFLIKMKKTGNNISMKKAINELNLNSISFWNGLGGNFSSKELDENEQLPIIDGEIEIIEVKSDKSFLASNQKKSYSNTLKAGYHLRYFHVDFISFKNNCFEIKEKIIREPVELNKLRTPKG